MDIHPLLLVTIFMASISTVNTLKCYGEASALNQPLGEGECTSGEQGCVAALECLNEDKTWTGVIRGCADHADFCNDEIKGSDGIKWNEFCHDCSYCTGDLCNDKGLKKTGHKCYHKERDDADDGSSVAECSAEKVGCLSAVKCGRDQVTLRGCIYTKDACTIDEPGSGGVTMKDICESCTFCDTEMCNDQGMGVDPPVEPPIESTPETVVKVPPNIGDEGATDPPNGAAGIVGWGQIGIIPIGMMGLAFAAGLLNMLMI